MPSPDTGVMPNHAHSPTRVDCMQDLVSGYDASQIGAVRPAPRRQKVFGRPWGDAGDSHLAPRASAGMRFVSKIAAV